MPDIDVGKTVTVLGQDYPVVLRTGRHSTAQFVVKLGADQELSDDTFHGLASQAVHFQDVRFQLPFTTQYGRDGTVTGFHAANGSMLVRWSNGKTSQERELYETMLGLTEEEKTELRDLTAAAEQAEANRKAFVQSRRIKSLREAADKARRKLLGID